MTVDQKMLAQAIEVYNAEAKRLAEIVREHPHLCGRVLDPHIYADAPLSLGLSDSGIELGYLADDYGLHVDSTMIPLYVANATPRELAAMEDERRAREVDANSRRQSKLKADIEAHERAEFERLKAKFGG